MADMCIVACDKEFMGERWRVGALGKVDGSVIGPVKGPSPIGMAEVVEELRVEIYLHEAQAEPLESSMAEKVDATLGHVPVGGAY